MCFKTRGFWDHEIRSQKPPASGSTVCLGASRSNVRVGQRARTDMQTNSSALQAGTCREEIPQSSQQSPKQQQPSARDWGQGAPASPSCVLAVCSHLLVSQGCDKRGNLSDKCGRPQCFSCLLVCTSRSSKALPRAPSHLYSQSESNTMEKAQAPKERGKENLGWPRSHFNQTSSL